MRRLMEAFNLPFRPGAGSSKEQKQTSDFFSKSKGKDKGATNGTLGEDGDETELTGSKRKRVENGDGNVNDIDQAEDEDDDVQVLPTPAQRSKASGEASPEWEDSDTETPAKSARPPAAPSPEWEMSDHEEPPADKGTELQSNGMLSAPWKDPLASDSDEDDSEPATKKARL